MSWRPAREGGAGVGGGVDRRTVVRSAVALTATSLLAVGGPGAAQARERDEAGGRGSGPTRERARVTPRLPAPGGPYPVGVTTLYLVDPDRPDPWEPRIRVRELMLTVRYPARPVHGYPVARQMTEAAAAVFGQLDAAVHRLPASGVNWAATRTHAHTDVPARDVPVPVLLYSPGGGDPRTLGTSLAEDLAGHGAVVVALDHPGDTSEVEFPVTRPGRPEKVRTTVFRGDPRSDADVFRTVIETRIADLRFVLGQLAVLAAGGNPDAAGRALPPGLGRALDLRRVGVYGHSAGGTAAAQAFHEDRRIRVAVDMEGYLDHPGPEPGRPGELFPVARDGVDRPLLLLGSAGFVGKGERERSWSVVRARSGGRVRQREVARGAHWVFTDYAAMAPQLAAAGLMSVADRRALVGPISPAESLPLVRSWVRSFFARHLPKE
ncbi:MULTISPECIES: alpha/beta hydrolase [unclassified Streptomyces]|uniref:alpha/beta hydrolase family protein n=1 Tax=unclassified Streptomyces TaxID=2593676 RepID=UPI00039E9F0E|nr:MULTISPECIES: alpha/beta hydrolase [unclassified Streptomyces]